MRMPVKAGIVGALLFGAVAWWTFLAYGIFQSIVAAVVGAAVGYGLFAWVAETTQRRTVHDRGGTPDVTRRRPRESEEELIVEGRGERIDPLTGRVERVDPYTGRVEPHEPRPGRVEPIDPEHRV